MTNYNESLLRSSSEAFGRALDFARGSCPNLAPLKALDAVFVPNKIQPERPLQAQLDALQARLDALLQKMASQVEGDGDGLSKKVDEVIKGVLGHRVPDDKVKELREACQKDAPGKGVNRAIQAPRGGPSRPFGG